MNNTLYFLVFMGKDMVEYLRGLSSRFPTPFEFLAEDTKTMGITNAPHIDIFNWREIQKGKSSNEDYQLTITKENYDNILHALFWAREQNTSDPKYWKVYYYTRAINHHLESYGAWH